MSKFESAGHIDRPSSNVRRAGLLRVKGETHQGGVGAGAGRHDHELPARFRFVCHWSRANWKRGRHARHLSASRLVESIEVGIATSNEDQPTPGHDRSRIARSPQSSRERNALQQGCLRSDPLPSPKGTRHAISPLLRSMATSSAYGGLVMGIGPSGLAGVSTIPLQ